MARPLSKEAREKTIAAAQEVLATDGVEGFTVDAVATRSGVAKTTIYRHFASGDELLIESIDCMIHPFATPNTGSLRSDIETFVEMVLPFVEDHTMQRTMMGIVSAAMGNTEFAQLHQKMMRSRTNPLRTMVELAQARGELRPELDVDMAVDMIEGPFFFRMIVRRENLAGDDIRKMAELIVDGLVVR